MSSMVILSPINRFVASLEIIHAPSGVIVADHSVVMAYLADGAYGSGLVLPCAVEGHWVSLLAPNRLDSLPNETIYPLRLSR